jgi:uncharacterized protein with ParB-like and HNH nuclease domain
MSQGKLMPSELQYLDTFFNSRVFRIPDYQRGYAWGARQLEDFWHDLNRLRDNRNHYTGQLTVEKVPEAQWKKWEEENWLIEGKGFRPYYVVDGQQRLTTAIILIKCLLSRVGDGQQLAFTERSDLAKKYLFQTAGSVSRAYLFGYEKDNPSYEYLKTQILGEASNHYQGVETTYTANLAFARNYFLNKVKELPHEDLERLFKGITQRFVFSIYELEGELDEFVVFETMNNRGKPLSRLELLKNRLIYLSTLFPVSSEGADATTLRHNVNEAWKTVYEYLGKVQDDPLDDDDFLRAHWIMYFSYARDRSEQFSSFLLDEHFTADRVLSSALKISDIQKYVNSIQASVRKWHSIYFPHLANDLSGSVRRALERLDRLGRGAFEPLMMAVLQKGTTETHLLKFLSLAERFVFLVGRVCQRRSDAGDSEFYRLASQLYRDDQTLPDVEAAISDRTSDFFRVDKAIVGMRELFDRYEGFYSWSGLKYFLFEYEQQLRGEAGMEITRLNWSEFVQSKKDHVTVEHIYPQTAKSADWPAFSDLAKKQREAVLNSLGNLLPLSSSRNAKFSNRPFEIKKQDANGVQGYYNGSYSEIQVAQHQDWTPEMIKARGLKMLGFLEKHWNISLGSPEEKLQFLDIGYWLRCHVISRHHFGRDDSLQIDCRDSCRRTPRNSKTQRHIHDRR